MKIIAATLALSVMLPSVVRAQAIEDDGTCPKLAENFKTIYFGFPDIKRIPSSGSRAGKPLARARRLSARKMSSLYAPPI